MVKKLYRSRSNRIFTGLSGGIAKFIGIDPTIVRAVLIILAFMTTGLAIIVYLIVALIVPIEPVVTQNTRKKVKNTAKISN